MDDSTQHSAWRTWAYRILVALFVLGLVGSTVAIWANVRIQQSDAWAETMGPLADDPAVQAFVVNQASAVIDRQIAADDNAGRLESFSRSQISGLVRMALHEFVTTPAFASWWAEANRTTHALVMRVMNDGESNSLQTTGGDLVLDLQPVVDWTNGQISELFPRTGYTITLPPERSTIVLYSSEALATTTRVLDLVDALSLVLPIVTLVTFVAAMIVARDRMNALKLIGIAVVTAMISMLVILLVARMWLVSRQPETHKDALDAIFRIVLADLVTAFRGLALLGLLLIIQVVGVKWIVQNRSTVGGFIRSNRLILAISAMGLALLTIIAVNYPPLWLISSCLLIIVVCGFLAARWRTETR